MRRTRIRLMTKRMRAEKRTKGARVKRKWRTGMVMRMERKLEVKKSSAM